MPDLPAKYYVDDAFHSLKRTLHRSSAQSAEYKRAVIHGMLLPFKGRGCHRRRVERKANRSTTEHCVAFHLGGGLLREHQPERTENQSPCESVSSCHTHGSCSHVN